ncbi:MAG: hypothetical protein A2289_26005 [Deltaproteobacteria bacterium RIFOXYA12_FULL_58_15]|nr:MAG: hypothetical protein A2289_26005 [Deltaproteobacteria bacterium RIFOXYA12_FULL_58_15]OGR12820.1 MAG: hypothetical protein A2341_23595 [Deltaproteobacteria bacterium RIFOXYB12_FULL_58_9]
MSLVLVGVRGSGKSTVGAMLAERLNLEFVDLDAAVEQQAGKSITAIFADEGEPAFRALESRVLANLADDVIRVVATGGGVVVSAENRRALALVGETVWLRVSPEQAVQRVQSSTHRPKLTELPPLEEAQKIANEREPYYEEVAEAVFSTDGKSAEQVCDELEQFWHSLTTDHLR